jgi:hypothetical protein
MIEVYENANVDKKIAAQRLKPHDYKTQRLQQTRAHRPRHVRAFWRSWLARLDDGFISRVTLGAVGALRRFLTSFLKKHGASVRWFFQALPE